MKEGERVEQMFNKLFVIVNDLYALRRIIFEKELKNFYKIMAI